MTYMGYLWYVSGVGAWGVDVFLADLAAEHRWHILLLQEFTGEKILQERALNIKL